MIQATDLINQFDNQGITLYTGVPDSLMADFCCKIQYHPKHRAVTNEAGAISLCIGHYLATGTPGVAYMQNSGLGNAHNPLVSLASADVYGIPMILLIGWRGSGPDEPQHRHQGKITPEHLNLLNIPIVDNPEDACALTLKNHSPVALLFQSGDFEKNTATATQNTGTSRLDSICSILKLLPKNSIIVSTTGKTSRELESVNKNLPVFLTVGGMGSAGLIGEGIANNTDRPVYIFDGDGAAQMHLGNMLSIKSKNLTHIIFRNGTHQSVGSQTITDPHFSFAAFAFQCGYSSTGKGISGLTATIGQKGPHLVEMFVNNYSDPTLKRPRLSPKENLKQFMSKL